MYLHCIIDRRPGGFAFFGHNAAKLRRVLPVALLVLLAAAAGARVVAADLRASRTIVLDLAGASSPPPPAPRLPRGGAAGDSASAGVRCDVFADAVAAGVFVDGRGLAVGAAASAAGRPTRARKIRSVTLSRMPAIISLEVAIAFLLVRRCAGPSRRTPAGRCRS